MSSFVFLPCAPNIVLDDLIALAEQSSSQFGTHAADEIVTFMNRRSFFEDLLKGFEVSKSGEEIDDVATTLDSDMEGLPSAVASQSIMHRISDAVWERVWSQFKLDVGREHFIVGTTRYVDPDSALNAVRKEVSLVVAQRTKRVDTYASLSWRKMAQWLSRTPVLQDSVDSKTVEFASRLVALFSQQSVLAFPFELMHAQYASHDAAMFIGEVSHPSSPQQPEAWMGSPSQQRRLVADGGMLVSLTAAGDGSQSELSLTVKKRFRLFSVDSGLDETKLFVDVTLSANILAGDDDPIQLTWRSSKVSNNSVSVQRCDCLGASSGFHRNGCTLKACR